MALSHNSTRTGSQAASFPDPAAKIRKIVDSLPHMTSEVVIAHGPCMDGLSCSLLWQQCYPKAKVYYTKPGEPIGWWRQQVWRWQAWRTGLRVVCLDLVPTNLPAVVRSLPRAHFEVIDHHRGNRDIVLALPREPRVLVSFEPESGYGATRQVMR